jgi:photosystem II stability/assembly factor-like uncharacterized protein
MAIKYYVKAAVSEYTDKDGANKKRYQTIGIVTETKKGDLMMKLEMIPFSAFKEGALWAYLNVPEEKTDQPKSLTDIEDVPF